MSAKPLSNEVLLATVEAYEVSGRSWEKAAAILKIGKRTVGDRLAVAAKRGLMLDHPAAMPGFEITKVASDGDGNVTHITQKQAPGQVSIMPETHVLGKMTVNRDGATGRVIQDWVRYEISDLAREAAMKAAVAGFTSEIPRAEPMPLPILRSKADLITQYTITDHHMGMLSWREETGSDYDLKIAEKLLVDFFTLAIRLSPDSANAIFAQLGDLLHFDGLLAVTPTHGHVLDADSRFAKIVRTVIRVLKQVIQMLLHKHEHVHLIMADANHDPASEIWLREMFAAFYENEPRLTIDRTASTYYAYQWGKTALFYHHGHKRTINDVDRVFAADYPEIFGSTKYRYGHVGHRHSDELIKTKLMKIEQHETLAARDAHAGAGGWRSGRSAKAIWYSKQFGETGRTIITPEMVMAA
ncbi:oxidoreductase [Bradyrhizobium sp. PMVTL-01]|uniref:oxidoreductase n=1 Tax=Bradyrhizobium sp. PMVTL-01 TaxID=3434999 RepID=UPI003F712B35